MAVADVQRERLGRGCLEADGSALAGGVHRSCLSCRLPSNKTIASS
jgi:hypothetical protein